MSQGAGERGALTHAARESAHRAGSAIGQIHQFKNLADPGRVIVTVNAREKVDVFPDGQLFI